MDKTISELGPNRADTFWRRGDGINLVCVTAVFKLNDSILNANSYTKKSEGKTRTGLYKSDENWVTSMLRHLETQPYILQRSVGVTTRRRIK